MLSEQVDVLHQRASSSPFSRRSFPTNGDKQSVVVDFTSGAGVLLISIGYEVHERLVKVTLKELDLFNNQIGVEGAPALAEAIKVNTEAVQQPTRRRGSSCARGGVPDQLHADRVFPALPHMWYHQAGRKLSGALSSTS